MYHSKRINYLILILLSIFFTGKVNALVSPTDKFYVNDYADVLSPETEEYIYEKSVKLNEVDGTQIVVVTVKNLEGRSLEDYSLELARNFKIGSKEKDNGLLLLLALEERKFRVEVGTGLEGILPDGKTGRFQDQYIIPYLKENNFDEGIKNGYNAFYNEIVELNHLDLDTVAPTSYSSAYLNVAKYLNWSVLSGFIIGILLAKFFKKNKIISFIYLTIWVILYTIYFSNPVYNFFLLVHIFFTVFVFLCTISATATPHRRRYRGSSGRGSFGGGGFSSGSGHSGGGGSFGGGGSSRGF